MTNRRLVPMPSPRRRPWYALALLALFGWPAVRTIRETVEPDYDAAFADSDVTVDCCCDDDQIADDYQDNTFQDSGGSSDE
jgi:hypothetical protein